jgi:hypothetical protein
MLFLSLVDKRSARKFQGMVLYPAQSIRLTRNFRIWNRFFPKWELREGDLALQLEPFWGIRIGLRRVNMKNRPSISLPVFVPHVLQGQAGCVGEMSRTNISQAPSCQHWENHPRPTALKANAHTAGFGFRNVSAIVPRPRLGILRHNLFWKPEPLFGIP